jgi:hypothetical protein
MVDAGWITRWLDTLIPRVMPAEPTPWLLFEPTTAFYARLASGEEGDLARAAQEIGQYLLLPGVPTVAYEWGIRMDPQVAGQIRRQRGAISHIQIPLYYVGRPHALGAILAHELTHERLAPIEEVLCSTVQEQERVTDLASMVSGLGKLVLNGLITEIVPVAGERQVLGYLDPPVIAYVYRFLGQRYGIAESQLMRNLTDAAIALLARVP